MEKTIVEMLEEVKKELVQRGYNEEDSLLLHVESTLSIAKTEQVK